MVIDTGVKWVSPVFTVFYMLQVFSKIQLEVEKIQFQLIYYIVIFSSLCSFLSYHFKGDLYLGNSHLPLSKEMGNSHQFPISSESSINYFQPAPHMWIHRPSKAASIRSVPLNQGWWHSLVADETHFLQFNHTQGAADSCVCCPCIKNKAPVNFCHMIHHFLMQLVRTQLCCVPWKYQFAPKIQ